MPRAPRRVTVIPSVSVNHDDETGSSTQLRVAAYCRVSTEQEQQQSSYQTQVSYYTQLITQKPEWIFAGIYADDGISATNTFHRDDFNRLIEDCLNGQIDMIITKSIARFARNTLDCIATVRRLRERGIAVYFEKEGINTLDETTEFLLTILSSQAQEESRTISTNVKWGLRRKYERGDAAFGGKYFYGYKKESGTLVIVPEEAEIVRKIFRWYLQGASMKTIAERLTEMKVPTATGRNQWQEPVLRRMLQNEKYIGDALLQKTYTVDFLSKKRAVNTGQLAQYYVEGVHEAIIPKALFYKVQEEMARRASMHKKSTKRGRTDKANYNSKYALSELVVCGECGKHYRRTIWTKPGEANKKERKIVWRCINRLEHGKKFCHNSPTISEESLHKAIAEKLRSMMESEGEAEFRDEIKKEILDTMETLYGIGTEESINHTIEELKQQLVHYAELASKSADGYDRYDEKFRLIGKEIADLNKKKDKLHSASQMQPEYLEQMSEVEKFFDQKENAGGYDDILVRKMVRAIRVESKEKLEMQMCSGEVVELRM